MSFGHWGYSREIAQRDCSRGCIKGSAQEGYLGGKTLDWLLKMRCERWCVKEGVLKWACLRGGAQIKSTLNRSLIELKKA